MKSSIVFILPGVANSFQILIDCLAQTIQGAVKQEQIDLSSVLHHKNITMIVVPMIVLLFGMLNLKW